MSNDYNLTNKENNRLLDQLADLSFDELNKNESNCKINGNTSVGNNEKSKLNALFTCSTPRQSKDMDNLIDSLKANTEDERMMFMNDQNIEKISINFDNNENLNNVSCDLLRSSKIDFDLNSELNIEAINIKENENNEQNNDDNNNTEVDITSSNLTNSIYSQFPAQQVVKSVRSTPVINYKTPINDVDNLIRNIRSNFKLNNNDSLYNEMHNFDTSSHNNDMTSINNKLNTIVDDLKLINHNNDAGCSNLNEKLEKEILKRQHCEKQIQELNKQKLYLEEQLAVVSALDHKKELFIHKLDKNLSKVMDSWKEKENQNQLVINKLQQDKEIALLNEANCMNRVKFLEDEMRQLHNELVNEKVKYQDCQREKSTEIQNLRKELNDLQKIDFEKSSKLEKLQNQITQFRDEKDSLEQRLVQLNQKIEEERNKYENNEKDMLNKINTLTQNNEKLNSQYESMQIEYEQLIKEAKLVVQESEVQYHQMVENIEAEKRAKDALQVEMTILEEKLENTVKLLNHEHENKMKKLETSYSDKEKTIIDKHKAEFNELNLKYKIETDALKAKYSNEIEIKTIEYEDKIKALSKKVDLLENEIRYLTETNKNLENERNTTRNNLKQMFEVQMKEAMQLLGLSSASTTFTAPTQIMTTEVKTQANQQLPQALPSMIYNQNSLIDDFKYNNNFTFGNSDTNQLDSYLKSSLPAVKEDKLQQPLKTTDLFDFNKKIDSNEPIKLSNVVTETTKQPTNDANLDIDTASSSIKDLFIKYQIDLINKCYDIDNNNNNAPVMVDSSLATNNNAYKVLSMETPRMSSTMFNDKIEKSQGIQKISTASKPVSNNSINASTSGTASISASASGSRVGSTSSINNINEINMKDNQQLTSFDGLLNQQQNIHQLNKQNLNNSTRTVELRHFIEMLLDRSPNSTVQGNEQDHHQIQQQQFLLLQHEKYLKQQQQQLQIDFMSKPKSSSSPIVNFNKTPPNQILKHQHQQQSNTKNLSNVSLNNKSGNYYYTSDAEENENSYYYTNNNNNNSTHNNSTAVTTDVKYKSKLFASSRSYLSDNDDDGMDYDERRKQFYKKNDENFDDIKRNLNFDFTNDNDSTPPSKISIAKIPTLDSDSVDVNLPQKQQKPMQSVIQSQQAAVFNSSNENLNKDKNEKQIKKLITNSKIPSQKAQQLKQQPVTASLSQSSLNSQNSKLKSTSSTSINNSNLTAKDKSVNTPSITQAPQTSIAKTSQKRVWK